MTTAFMLDTSYLITLVDDNRPYHQVARRYFEHALQTGTPLHVSTLVLAEFAVKQDVADLPLRNLRVEPFNVMHATKAGKLVAALAPSRDPADSRSIVRADLQILAQAEVEGIQYILTEDESTLSKYVARSRAGGHSQCQAVLLKGGFDTSWFNNGQHIIA